MKIDPTKLRPSGEALLRRILHGNSLPNVSTPVDAYSLASAKTIIPISGFDLDRLELLLRVRFASKSEELRGINEEKNTLLTKDTLVLADGEKILCIYPYKDANGTKITEQAKKIVIIAYGAPKSA